LFAGKRNKPSDFDRRYRLSFTAIISRCKTALRVLTERLEDASRDIRSALYKFFKSKNSAKTLRNRDKEIIPQNVAINMCLIINESTDRARAGTKSD